VHAATIVLRSRALGPGPAGAQSARVHKITSTAIILSRLSSLDKPVPKLFSNIRGKLTSNIPHPQRRANYHSNTAQLGADRMASTNTVDWLRKEMQGALRLGLPLVGCSDWPNPVEADPPELRRMLDETDVRRAVDLAHRRGIANGYIVAVWNAAKASENSTWMTDFIDTLDNLPPGNQPEPPSPQLTRTVAAAETRHRREWGEVGGDDE
jgi:hypothetical protein